MRLFHFSLRAFKAPLAYVLPALAVVALFAVFPEIDLAVSGWFYDAQRGGFWLAGNRYVGLFGYLSSMVSTIFVAICLLLYIYGITRKRMYWGLERKLVIYFGLVMVIGPLLVVTMGFKEFWGRPRPVEVAQFGGAHAFVPFYRPSHACETDCSFPSGHSARAFYFLALAFAVYRLHPKRSTAHTILAAAILFGLLAAGQRIITGRHFLSDVILSALILAYVSWVLYRLIWPPHTPAPKLPDIEDAIQNPR